MPKRRIAYQVLSAIIGVLVSGCGESSLPPDGGAGRPDSSWFDSGENSAGGDSGPDSGDGELHPWAACATSCPPGSENFSWMDLVTGSTYCICSQDCDAADPCGSVPGGMCVSMGPFQRCRVPCDDAMRCPPGLTCVDEAGRGLTCAAEG